MEWETVGPEDKKQKSQKAKAKTPIYKKWWLWAIVIVVLILFFYSIGSADSGEDHIYDDAEVVDIENAYGELLWQYSVIEMDSSEFTEEVMEDWCYNYIGETDYSDHYIIFTDIDGYGVYASHTINETSGYDKISIWTDVTLTYDGNTYDYEETDETVEYICEDGVLSEWWRHFDESDTVTEYTEITEGMSSALAAAEEYLEDGCSYSALINKLRNYDGYTTEEAVYAADNCGANWYEQAVLAAEAYLPLYASSALIEELEYEDFTTAEITYAVESIDWYEQAVLAAEWYLEYGSDSGYTYSEMVEQLENDGYTAEEAAYGADNCGAEWNEE